ncbi:MAG: hypothetical protein E7508_09120 [Ruminococcus sp.]|nr:hypothetical protein [Ruminococcus sp.]
MMRNSLFSFATGELSQDAFICWCANWVNFKDDESGLYDMGVEFVKLVSGVENIESVVVMQQYKKIDVLLLINNNTAVIIEDKTFTGEHSNQINRYKDIVLNEINSGNLNLDKQNFQIVTTFFKTGEYYPNDVKTAAYTDINITRENMMKLLEKYISKSDIIRDYYDRLDYLDRWYSEYKGYYKKQEYDKAFCENWGQYCCAKDLFMGKKMLGQFADRDVIIESGSSYGRPYTWIWMWGKTDWYWLGYRIDSDKKGYFISLRLYRECKKADKSNSILSEKTEIFNKIKSVLNDEINARKIDCVIAGNRASYNESELGKFYFAETGNDLLKNNLYDIVEKLVKIIEADFEI